MTVKDILESLGLNNGIVGFVLVNDQNLVKDNYKIRDGDNIKLYPIFEGG